MSVVKTAIAIGHLGETLRLEWHNTPPPGYDPVIHADPDEDGLYRVLAGMHPDEGRRLQILTKLNS